VCREGLGSRSLKNSVYRKEVAIISRRFSRRAKAVFHKVSTDIPVPDSVAITSSPARTKRHTDKNSQAVVRTRTLASDLV
jgi:hypothetical protein